jgi:hypothetical protein
VFGLKIEHERKKRDIRTALIDALSEKAETTLDIKRGAAE